MIPKFPHPLGQTVNRLLENYFFLLFLFWKSQTSISEQLPFLKTLVPSSTDFATARMTCKNLWGELLTITRAFFGPMWASVLSAWWWSFISCFRLETRLDIAWRNQRVQVILRELWDEMIAKQNQTDCFYYSHKPLESLYSLIPIFDVPVWWVAQDFSYFS